jgi:hypothetical protein
MPWGLASTILTTGKLFKPKHAKKIVADMSINTVFFTQAPHNTIAFWLKAVFVKKP